VGRGQSERSTDSFDLLLDCICNVFGGIMLMAILVVLQIQTSADQMPPPKPEVLNGVLLARQLDFERKRLEQNMKSLLRERAIVERKYLRSVSPTMQRLLDATDEHNEAIQRAQKEIDALHEEMTKDQKVLTKVELQLREIEETIKDRAEEKKDLEKQAGKLSKRVPRNVRLPHQRGGISGDQVNIVVKGGKFYRLEGIDYFSGPYRSGGCIVTPILSLMAVRIEPDPLAGYAVPGKGDGVASVRRLLAETSPATHSISFWVCGDSLSFESFQTLKNLILERGYEYSVSAYDPKEGLVLGRGIPDAE